MRLLNAGELNMVSGGGGTVTQNGSIGSYGTTVSVEGHSMTVVGYTQNVTQAASTVSWSGSVQTGFTITAQAPTGQTAFVQISYEGQTIDQATSTNGGVATCNISVNGNASCSGDTSEMADSNMFTDVGQGGDNYLYF